MSQADKPVTILEYDGKRLAPYEEQRNVVRQAVLKALQWLYSGLQEQGWSGVKKPEELVDHVIDEYDLLLVGETLVAYSVGEVWFLQGLVISEEFVAPIGEHPADLKLVVEALTKIGSLLGCSRLSLGTRANPRQEALARLFRQSGLSVSTIELTREIPHVQEDWQGIQEGG